MDVNVFAKTARVVISDRLGIAKCCKQYSIDNSVNHYFTVVKRKKKKTEILFCETNKHN